MVDIKDIFVCGKTFVYGLKEYRDPIIWKLKYLSLDKLFDQKKITKEQHNELSKKYQDAEQMLTGARISAHKLFNDFSNHYSECVPKSRPERYFRVDELNDYFAVALECEGLSVEIASTLPDDRLLSIFQKSMATAMQIENQAPRDQIGSQEYLDEMKQNKEFCDTADKVLGYFNIIKNIDTEHKYSNDISDMRLHGCLASMQAYNVIFILDGIKLSLSDSFGYTVHEFIGAYKMLRDSTNMKISFYFGGKLVEKPWKNPSINNARMFIADNTDCYIKSGKRRIPEAGKQDIVELAIALGDENLELLQKTSNNTYNHNKRKYDFFSCDRSYKKRRDMSLSSKYQPKTRTIQPSNSMR